MEMDMLLNLVNVIIEFFENSIISFILENAPNGKDTGYVIKTFTELPEPRVPTSNINDDKSFERKVLEAVLCGFGIFAIYIIYTALTEKNDLNISDSVNNNTPENANDTP